MADWYSVENAEMIDSPALLVYPERVAENIRILKSFVKSPDLLRPHVKTHKSPEATKMLLEAGIHKFKCATIAEAEMLAQTGAKDILLAYQPVGPKAQRFLELHKHFPDVKFSCLVDDAGAARHLSDVFAMHGKTARVYIDLNIGMNRTGILPALAPALIEILKHLSGVDLVGLHAYDGQLREPDLTKRKVQCDAGFAQVTELATAMHLNHLPIVAGGTPSFPIHAARGTVECSPGTFIYWDNGYHNLLPEQPFFFGALLLTRIISAPDATTLCADLGHKAIASENPLDKRVYFLNAPDLVPIGHSEEHLVLRAPAGHSYRVGDVLYGLPHHICPTCALHDTATTIQNNHVSGSWRMLARKRKLTI